MFYRIGNTGSCAWTGVYECRGWFVAQWGFCASSASQELGTFGSRADAEQALVAFVVACPSWEPL